MYQFYSFTPELLLRPQKGIFVQGNLIKLWSCLTSTCYFRLWTSITQNQKNGWNLQLITCNQPLRKNGYITLNSTQNIEIPIAPCIFTWQFGAEKTHGNTLKMVPNVPPIFPYCFPCVKWSPSHGFFMVMSVREKIWEFLAAGSTSHHTSFWGTTTSHHTSFEAEKGDNLAPFPGNSHQLKGFHLPSDDASVLSLLRKGTTQDI